MVTLILTGQNIDIYEGDGKDQLARTGATSIAMLEKAGAQGVIVGHSEVADTLDVVTSKLRTLLKKRENDPYSLPYCTVMVGESWEEFNKHTLEQVTEIVSSKLFTVLSGAPEDFVKNLVVCYEPQWGSRGSGHDDEAPPTPALISAVVKSMREKLTEMFEEVGKSVPIIYGGRSTPERTEEILAEKNVDGLILGSACNTVVKTLGIAHAMEKAMGKRKKILHANFKAYNLPDSYAVYVKELKKLDDTFIVYLSPCHTDISEVKAVL